MMMETGTEFGAAFEAGIKCVFAAWTVTEEFGTVVFSAFAFASTPTDGPVGIGVGSTAYGVAIYNREYTIQTVQFCFGGDVPTADSVVFWHP
jgi:hypothetical protein